MTAGSAEAASSSAESEGAGSREIAEARHLFVLVGVSAALLLTVNYEVVVRQAGAYLSHDPRAGWLPYLSALGGMVTAGALAKTRSIDRYVVRVFWPPLALLVGASGIILSRSFERGAALAWVVTSLCFGVPLLSLHASLVVSRQIRAPLRELGGLRFAVRPFGLLAAGTLFAVLTSATTLVGFLRSGALLGMLLGLLGPLWLWIFRYLFPSNEGAKKRASAPGYIASLLSLGVLIFAERELPLAEIAKYSGTLVFAKSSPRARYVVTAAQDNFSLFVNGELKSSGVDGYRYYEALVHPVMAAAERRERCLVIGPADGMAARELLRYADVTSVTLVTLDRTLAKLASRASWLGELNGGALESPAVTLIEEEALPWLRETSDVYDVILVDAADPTTYGKGLEYTRYFYEELARHLGPGGKAAIQATSATRSERTLATILATLQAAGFSSLPYRAPVPTLGEWAFVLVSLQPLAAPTALAATLRGPLAFLNDASLRDLFTSAAPKTFDDIEPSRLHRQTAVDAFREERHAQ